jgi:hypothetical protein
MSDRSLVALHGALAAGPRANALAGAGGIRRRERIIAGCREWVTAAKNAAGLSICF